MSSLMCKCCEVCAAIQILKLNVLYDLVRTVHTVAF